MPRNQSRIARRIGNRRGANRAVARAVRIARNAPLARVRANPTIRSRGVASANINALRRFAFFPKKIKSSGELDTKWWIEGLKWAGLVAMKILATALASDYVEEFLRRHPLPAEHPLTGALLTASIPTGAIIRLAFGPEDFLGESDFINSSTSPAIGHYRQGRIEWVKIIINPSSHISSRGGMIAAALIPCNKDQMKDDFGSRATEAHDLSELLKTPGVVYKTMTTPTTLTYSPTPTLYAYNWLQFGCQNAATGLYGAGGDCCLYLDIGIHNLASDTKDQTTNYSLASCLSDVTVAARVHLREYDEGVSVRTGPVSLTNTASVGIFNGLRTQSVDESKIYIHKGVLLTPNIDVTIDAMTI